MTNGGEIFLAKPVKLETLVACIHEHLNELRSAGFSPLQRPKVEGV